MDYWGLEVGGTAKEELWTTRFRSAYEGIWDRGKESEFLHEFCSEEKSVFSTLVHFSLTLSDLLERLPIPLPDASHFPALCLWVQIPHSKCWVCVHLNSCLSVIVLNTGCMQGVLCALWSSPHWLLFFSVASSNPNWFYSDDTIISVALSHGGLRVVMERIGILK